VDQAQEKSKDSEQNPNQKKIPFWRIMLSVMQASIGVQNAKNRERDFTQGSLVPFIVAALLFTGVFVLVVLFAVKMALG
tara:strand:- start:642 stop:878 length:237 start_codon:yes stop_codon:yes gene_type:complete